MLELLMIFRSVGCSHFAKGWWVVVDTEEGQTTRFLWESEEEPNFDDLAQAIRGIAESVKDLDLVLELAQKDKVLVRRERSFDLKEADRTDIEDIMAGAELYDKLTGQHSQ